MRESERRQHETDARGYMRQCTDRQLDGVIEQEQARLRGLSEESDVAICAHIMVSAARVEKERRGI